MGAASLLPRTFDVAGPPCPLKKREPNKDTIDLDDAPLPTTDARRRLESCESEKMTGPLLHQCPDCAPHEEYSLKPREPR
jgi:hypothetical protein